MCNKRFRGGLVVSLLLVWIAFTPTTHAHVLVFDEPQSAGTVLHLTPDDDPIAGEPSTFYFDLADHAITKASHVFALAIASQQTKEQTLVPISVGESSVSALYTFPSRGIYTITLTAEPVKEGAPAIQFKHTQHVSRGVVTSELHGNPAYVWAGVGLLVSVCALAVVVVLAFTRRAKAVSTR